MEVGPLLGVCYCRWLRADPVGNVLLWVVEVEARLGIVSIPRWECVIMGGGGRSPVGNGLWVGGVSIPRWEWVIISGGGRIPVGNGLCVGGVSIPVGNGLLWVVEVEARLGMGYYGWSFDPSWEWVMCGWRFDPSETDGMCRN